MRRRGKIWLELGIAALGLLLVCGSVQWVAQAPAARAQAQVPAQGYPDAGQAMGQQAQEVELWQEIGRLSGEVVRLQQELARMRAQLTAAGVIGEGVGGAGTAGIGEPAAEAEAGATGLGAPSAEGVGGGGRAGATRPDTADQGTALVNIIYTGRVRSVSQQQMVLAGEGGEAPTTLPLASNVRVIRDGQRVPLSSLKQGTLVRATADLLTPNNLITEILVLPPPARGGAR